jgi:hypothetical protein
MAFLLFLSRLTLSLSETRFVFYRIVEYLLHRLCFVHHFRIIKIFHILGDVYSTLIKYSSRYAFRISLSDTSRLYLENVRKLFILDASQKHR